MVSIKIKLMVVCLLISLVPVAILGFMNLNKSQDILQDSIQESLTTIVNSKESALEAYLTTTEKIAKSVADSDDVKEYVSYLNRELTEEETVQFEALKKRVDNMIYSFMEVHWGVEYHHIFITDKNGHIMLSPNHGANEKGSPSSHLEHDISSNPWFAKALERPQVTDFSTWEESNHFHQLLMYPLKDANGVTQGVIGFELMISHETNILSENFELGETGTVFLASLEGVPVVHLKADSKPALSTKGITKAIESGFSSGISKNSEGVEVIGFYLKNEKYPWVMVAEIETQEAFSGLNQIKQFFGTVFSVTTIIVVVLSLLFSLYIVNPIKSLTAASRKIGEGEIDTPLPEIKTKDEISELSQTIESLVGALRFFKAESSKKKK